MNGMDVIARAERLWGIPHGECHEEAVTITELAVAELKDRAAREPDNAGHSQQLSWALINLAQLLSAGRDLARADAVALESVAIMRRALAR
jgi:hypothetical protein